MNIRDRINKAHIINHLINTRNYSETPEWQSEVYLQSLDVIADYGIKLPLCYEGTTVPVSAIKVGNDIGKAIGGYFASSQWLETGDCRGVVGSSFGWKDVFDTKLEYKESKSDIKKLTQQEWDNLTFDQKLQLI